MAGDAADIVAGWRRNVAPTVSKEEVEKVVRAYFSGAYTHGTTGSHWIIVEHEALRIAWQQGWTSRIRGGTLSIPLSGGRHVKKVYVQNLLEAIDLKEAFDRAQEG
jgi:hypothetical protein